MRPIIKQSSAEKVFRYFFGENWKIFRIIELAIRHKKINLFDDELYIWNAVLRNFKTFNWNADPSAFRIGNDEIAILRTGVHFFKISYHHIWDDKKRYVALRPNTPNEELPVLRTDKNGKFYFSIGRAINQHAGGDRTTGSRGCQTAPRLQYAEFIQYIGAGFGVKIPLGIQRKAEKRFLDGIGNIPYILLTQEQFNYIQNLPEAEFDSIADQIYQQKNFVNLPKIQKVVPAVSKPNSAAAVIVNDLETEENEAILTEKEFDEQFDNLTNSAVVPAENPLEIIPSVSIDPPDRLPNNPPDEQPPIAGTISEKVKQTVETATGTFEKTVQETKDTFNPKNLPAFIPRFGKQWLLSFIPGAGFLATIGTWVLNAPVWVQIFIAVVTIITLWKIFELIIKHREKVLDFITNCYSVTANPELDNLIPTDASEFVGNRQNALLSAFAPPVNKTGETD